MSNIKTIIWGFIQALIVIIICYITLLMTVQMQEWEAPRNGFLDDLILLVLVGVAALISGIAVLAYPAYLLLSKRTKEGFLLLFSTVVWLVLILGCFLAAIVFLDIHTIF